MWNEIVTQNDAEDFLKLFGFFHDSCIKELHYISGASVDEDLSMNPINNIRTVDITFQRQEVNPTSIIMRFEGITTLHLAPYDEQYTCEILDASLLYDDNYFYWADTTLACASEIKNYEGTWISSNKLRWKSI